jgi:hypothetical protein
VKQRKLIKRDIQETKVLKTTQKKANEVEIFVRFSAYEDDKRIDFDNKKRKPGSYTTTEQDYKD